MKTMQTAQAELAAMIAAYADASAVATAEWETAKEESVATSPVRKSVAILSPEDSAMQSLKELISGKPTAPEGYTWAINQSRYPGLDTAEYTVKGKIKYLQAELIKIPARVEPAIGSSYDGGGSGYGRHAD